MSSWVSKGPCTRPALMSSSALSKRASIIRRCAGVYSSSAFGNPDKSGTVTALRREDYLTPLKSGFDQIAIADARLGTQTHRQRDLTFLLNFNEGWHRRRNALCPEA